MARTKVNNSQINSGAQQAYIATNEAVTSPSAYTDLATVGPQVTVIVGSSGMLLVSVYCNMAIGVSTSYQGMGFALSGANTLAASDDKAIFCTVAGSNGGGRWSGVFLLTGLTPGSTVVTAKYKTGVSAGYTDRRIVAVPL